MKIINNHTRNGLHEGRNYGMCFGFLKKITNSKFETTTPISACKDYLNDALYAEKTGRILPSIYGFKYDKINNNVGKFYTYLGIRIEQTLERDTHYDQNEYKADLKNLENNYKNLENFMNQLEEKIGIYHKTKIIKANDDLFLVKMPSFWTKRIYLLSLYTLLLRAFQYYKPEITAEKAIKKNNVKEGDTFMLKGIQDKIKRILNGELPKQELSTNLNSNMVHNLYGIVSYKFL